ncbi:cobalamin biosynthesis protein CobQ [Candidatus Endobugula sertula]|uniref:Cobalamin biosynthesis protein CobQ n=1 Tax=Candidatus Endobugula sertula TaxID=62101 RepID=A0A1D2QQ44_9GAMM|nr:cobalamin biosynthesis protein CobQ [Candidatus Endobugula sertula]
MQVWTVANQKGGVGKTTTSVALAGLAAEQGQRVLLIDLDPQGSMTSYFGGDPDNTPVSVFTLFQDKAIICLESIVQLLIPTRFERMTLLPASTALATLERHGVGKGGLGLVICRTIEQVQDEFDLVVIDSPPVLGVLLINALAACDRLIIPVQTEYLALKGLDRMIHTLRMLSQSQQRLLEYVIVPTMFDQRTHASVGSLSSIRHKYGTQTWPSKIPVDTRLRDASKAGIPPHLFDSNSHSINSYRSLYQWLDKSQRKTEKVYFWTARQSLSGLGGM